MAITATNTSPAAAGVSRAANRFERFGFLPAPATTLLFDWR
jgi:hypothetical protein